MVPSSPALNEHRSTPHRRRAASGLLARSLPIVVVLVIVAATITSVLSFSSARTLASAQDQSERSDALIEIQAELAWLHQDLLVAGVLAFQRTSTVTPPDGFDRLRAERAALVARLDTLAETPDAVGETAAEVSHRMVATPIDTWPIDLWSIDSLHYEAMPVADRFSESGGGLADLGDPATPTSEGLTSGDLINAAQTVPLARFVLLDAIALDLAASPEPFPSWGVEFLDVVVDTVNENPGWFGPDPDRPFTDHVMTSSSSSEPLLIGAAVDQVSSSVDLVTAYDRWLIAGAGAGDSGPPPASIDELAAAVERTTAALSDAVRAGFETKRSNAETSLIGGGPIGLRLLLGGLSAALSVALIGLGLMWWNRRRHHLADAAYSDPLTGAGNRRFLDEVVSRRFGRAGQTHVVAMLDMDRFKLVNDTWGHDAGDALLRTLSERLHDEVEAFCQNRSGSSHAVIRLGGDEFVVIVHGPTGLDAEELAERLRSVAGPVDLGLEEEVDLAFSLGLVVTDEPCQLADLLKTADLATYEDKQTGPVSAERTAAVDVVSLEAS